MSSRIRKSAVLATAAVTLAAPLALAGPAQAAPVPITCTSNTTSSDVTPSCTRNVDDGDAGGVSGAVRLTTTTGEYARVEFQAKGEKVIMRNTWRAWKGVFTLHIRTSDGWKKHKSWRVDSGTSLTSTFNIAEGTRVAITACMEAAMFGCAGNNRLVA